LNLPDSLSDGKTWTSYFDIQRKYLFQYGGVAIDIPDNFKMFKIMFLAKEYTLKEKLQFNDGYAFSLQHLSPVVTKVNFLKDIDSLEIPLYFLQGRHDYATPYALVEQFYTKIKAPKKELISFEKSAHGPHIEESARFNEIVRKKVRL